MTSRPAWPARHRCRAARAPPADSAMSLALRGYTPPPRGDQLARRSRPSSSAAARTGARARAKLRRGIRVRDREKYAGDRRPPAAGCASTAACRCRTRRRDMSPMPATVKWLALDVDAHFAEVALDAFPGAARGDAHLLVVVAGRAARGERVAEPEAVLGGRWRWRCRRTSRCPCRRRPRDRDRRRRGARPLRAARSCRRRCCR